MNMNNLCSKKKEYEQSNNIFVLDLDDSLASLDAITPQLLSRFYHQRFSAPRNSLE